MQKVITDDLDALVDTFPTRVRQPLRQVRNLSGLLEVVLDLGRPPEARFPDGEVTLDPKEVTGQDIEYVTSHIGSFGDDNRAGIARTLHRISAIRNRKGDIVGLTCRVGRAVFGTIKVIEDLVGTGKSILLLGRPGVGKTTMLREMARVLADDLKKRVIIVDTSNEIAGDGDIPHPAIGHARRMQVVSPNLQHAVMIEAVENHMPQVIVIDEIGTELEAQAARTIAERGVQLIGTAHGNTLENLMANPTLADLIGGIQSVTLSDEEARRRGTQKSVLERTAPPTFNIVVEIQGWDRVAFHPDVALAVDATLRGEPLAKEIRWRDENGEIKTEVEKVEKIRAGVESKALPEEKPRLKAGEGYRLYLFGVDRGRLEQIAREMHLDLKIMTNLADANLFVTSKNYYRRKPQRVRDAESANLPIYVLRSSSPVQVRQMLHTISSLGREAAPKKSDEGDNLESAITEAEAAVNQVRGGEEMIELSPQSNYIRRLQHLIAERHHLHSDSVGRDPERHVRIYRR
ncbi:MAG: R3H domain-containing nucleic acid-binding protein [Chloroflexota bacterium]